MRPRHAVLAVLLFALLLPSSAGAIPLGTLVGGGTIASDDGAVVFADFAVRAPATFGEQSNPLASFDLMLIEVEVITLGDVRTLAFAGAVDVAAYELGQLRIDYRATAGDGFSIVGALLDVAAKTYGPYSMALVRQSILDGASNELASLEVVTRSDTAESPSARALLEAPADELYVRSTIWVDGGTVDGTQLTHVAEGFVVSHDATAVPEPGAALLFAAGTFVIGVRIRRIRR